MRADHDCDGAEHWGAGSNVQLGFLSQHNQQINEPNRARHEVLYTCVTSTYPPFTKFVLPVFRASGRDQSAE